MRLREMESIVKDLLPEIEPDLVAVDSGNSRFYFSNYYKTISKILELGDLGFIDSEVEALKKISPVLNYRSLDNEIIVGSDIRNTIISITNEIKRKSTVVLDVARITTTSEGQDSIDVKLPDFNDLKQASKFFNDLSNALEIIVVNEDVGGKIELQGFESGSMWITIAVGTPIAVKLIGQIVSLALEMRVQYYESEQIKLATKSLGLSVKAQEELVDGLKNKIDTQLTSKSSEVLENSVIKDKSPEFTSRFNLGTKMITELIYQGTQIHPSLMSPKENKQSFPDYPELKTDEIKLLKELIVENETEE
jgi:hypothetical protein